MRTLVSPVRRRSPGARAYTAIEVMLAMTVLLISSAGVIAMQKASIQGNQDARKLDVANSIARTWLDRLAADASSWVPLCPNNCNGLEYTNWLGPYLGKGFVTPGTLTGGVWAYSAAADILGRDLTLASGDAATVFCTHINVSLVSEFPTPTSAGVPEPALIQATVLVFWPKNINGAQGFPATAADMCGVKDVAGAEATSPGTYHMIYVTESFRRNS